MHAFKCIPPPPPPTIFALSAIEFATWYQHIAADSTTITTALSAGTYADFTVPPVK